MTVKSPFRRKTQAGVPSPFAAGEIFTATPSRILTAASHARRTGIGIIPTDPESSKAIEEGLHSANLRGADLRVVDLRPRW